MLSLPLLAMSVLTARGGGGRSVPQAPPLVLLVLQADKYDWTAIIRSAVSKGGTRPRRDIGVVQTSWEHIQVGPCSNEAVLSHDGRHVLRYGTAQVQVAALFRNGEKEELQPRLTISPDFVLVRNECVAPHFSHRHQLLGLLYANLPSINSLGSILLNCDRPVMHSALQRVRLERFAEQPAAFPLIAQDFYPSAAGFFYGHSFPAVVKFGSAHAGLGKLRVANHRDMRDVQGLLSSTKEGFATGEPYIDAECDLRIQKIGSTVRAYERRSVSGEWKTNTGSSEVVEIPVTEQFRQWADAATVMFGQSEDDRMDIVTVDGIVSRPHPSTGVSGTFILEANGTSSGLMPEHEEEDNLDIAALVLQKMHAIYDR